MDFTKQLVIASIKGYNAKRNEALKILSFYGLKKNATNKTALNFIFYKLENCPDFYRSYTKFLVKNGFLSRAPEKRNIAFAAILGAVTSVLPLLGKIGQGKQTDAEQDIAQQETTQEMIRLMQVQADADSKKKQTQTIIAVVVIIAVFSIVGIIIFKS